MENPTRLIIIVMCAISVLVCKLRSMLFYSSGYALFDRKVSLKSSLIYAHLEFLLGAFVSGMRNFIY